MVIRKSSVHLINISFNPALQFCFEGRLAGIHFRIFSGKAFRSFAGFSTYAAKLLNALPEKIQKMDTSKPAFKMELQCWIKTYIN